MNEIPEPHAILALRVIAVGMGLTFVCLISSAAVWLAPKACTWRERLAIAWRDYRRPIAHCHYCSKPFRTLRAFIKHHCPITHPECSDL